MKHAKFNVTSAGLWIGEELVAEPRTLREFVSLFGAAPRIETAQIPSREFCYFDDLGIVLNNDIELAAITTLTFVFKPDAKLFRVAHPFSGILAAGGIRITNGTTEKSLINTTEIPFQKLFGGSIGAEFGSFAFYVNYGTGERRRRLAKQQPVYAQFSFIGPKEIRQRG